MEEVGTEGRGVDEKVDVWVREGEEGGCSKLNGVGKS